jgi:hypothetical protein
MEWFKDWIKYSFYFNLKIINTVFNLEKNQN